MRRNLGDRAPEWIWGSYKPELQHMLEEHANSERFPEPIEARRRRCLLKKRTDPSIRCRNSDLRHVPAESTPHIHVVPAADCDNSLLKRFLDELIHSVDEDGTPNPTACGNIFGTSKSSKQRYLQQYVRAADHVVWYEVNRIIVSMLLVRHDMDEPEYDVCRGEDGPTETITNLAFTNLCRQTLVTAGELPNNVNIRLHELLFICAKPHHAYGSRLFQEYLENYAPRPRRNVRDVLVAKQAKPMLKINNRIVMDEPGYTRTTASFYAPTWTPMRVTQAMKASPRGKELYFVSGDITERTWVKLLRS